MPISFLLFPIFTFPRWWYFDNLSFWRRFIPRTLILVFDSLGIGEITRNFFRPYRDDRTLVGYGIGISIRFFYLIFALMIFILFFALLLLTFVLYLIWPLTGLAALFKLPEGSFLSAAVFFLSFIPCLFLFRRNYLEQPRRKILEISKMHTHDAIACQVCILAMTPVARKIWQKVSSQPYSPALLLRQFYDYPKMGEAMRRLNFNQESIFKKLVVEAPLSLQSEIPNFKHQAPENFQAPSPKTQTGKVLNWESVVLESFKLGWDSQHDYIDTDLLFLGLIKADPNVEKVFQEEGLSFKQLQMVTRWMEEEKARRNSWKYWEDKYFHRRGAPDLGWVAGWTPTLKHFTTDITKLIKQGRLPDIVGREKEVEKVVEILSGVTRNNVLLVGPAGVGKTSIVYAIAQRLLTGEQNLSSAGKLQGKRILSLDAVGLLSGTAGRGDLEWRIKEAVHEAEEGDVILFIDEIEVLVKVGVAEYLSPTLSSGVLQIIGTTTPTDLHKTVKPLENFTSYFQIVEVTEPTDEEAIEILEGVIGRIEQAQKVRVSFAALEAAVKLTRRYLHDRVLPDKAIGLLDEIATRQMVKAKGKKEKEVVITEQDVAAVLSEKIRIPIEKITQEESEKLLHLEEILHQRIIGQDLAISALVNALRRARSGLVLGSRPLGSFLFIGPTGVGKTESAKTLSSAYFGSEELLRFDMSEFAEHGMVANFTQRICEAVRSRPFAVVLLDEFEKAEADIHNLFLQVMDEGRLTDLEGEAADFTNVFLIATSNAPDLYAAFRPELLNRFDGIIKFLSLTPEQVKEIAKLLLAQVAQRLKEQQIAVEFSEEVVSQIVQLGFDPNWGARPLRRVIQEKIENKLAEMLLKRELQPGQKMFFGPEYL